MKLVFEFGFFFGNLYIHEFQANASQLFLIMILNMEIVYQKIDQGKKYLFQILFQNKMLLF